MNRPGTRGGGPGGGGGADPTQMSMRPQMMRPGTGARAALGSRQGTARQGPVNMSGVGLNTNMSISDRPVTQQGLSGMKTAGMGPARQIQDNSFYLQQLRAKCSEIQKEIGTLKEVVEQGQRDNSAYGQLERKYEVLTNDMRTLQGQLADHNLLLDRTRVHREVDDVMEEAHALAQTNHADRQRVDELFQHRTALESQARDVEHQLMRHHAELADTLEQVDPNMKETFLKLTGRHQLLANQELPKRQADLAFFDERVREMEAAVARDPARSKAYRYREELMRLERLHHAISAELDGPQLSEAEQKEQLLARVKADNASIAEGERRLTEAQDFIRSGKKQLSQLANDLSDANDPKAKKYEVRDASDATRLAVARLAVARLAVARLARR